MACVNQGRRTTYIPGADKNHFRCGGHILANAPTWDWNGFFVHKLVFIDTMLHTGFGIATRSKSCIWIVQVLSSWSKKMRKSIRTLRMHGGISLILALGVAYFTSFRFGIQRWNTQYQKETTHAHDTFKLLNFKIMFTQVQPIVFLHHTLRDFNVIKSIYKLA